MAKRDGKGRFIVGEPQPTNKNGTAGRPTKMTEKIVRELKLAFCYGMTDEQACEFAGISKPTLYRYIEENPEFGNQKKSLKQRPSIKAKMNWVEEIQEGDYNASKERLERKNSDEFSTKQSVEHGGGIQLEDKISEDAKKIANEVIKTDEEKSDDSKSQEKK